MKQQFDDPTKHATFPKPEEIQAWKTKFQIEDLITFTVEDKILILRKPKIVDWERAAVEKGADKNKPYNFQRSIISNCKLYATPGMEADDDTMMVVYAKIDELDTKKELEVGKL